MARSSAGTQVVGVIAAATGRTDEEVTVALTVGVVLAAAVSAVLAALHLLNFLEDLDIYVFGPSGKRS